MVVSYGYAVTLCTYGCLKDMATKPVATFNSIHAGVGFNLIYTTQYSYLASYVLAKCEMALY